MHFAVSESDIDGRFRWPLTRPLGTDDPMAALCRYLAWLPGSRDPAAAAAVRATVEFLLVLFVNGPLPSAGTGASRHVQQFAGWLAARWHDEGVGPVGVAEAARGVGLSAGHLSRICRAEFGAGPAEVVELLRLGRAAVLLRRSNLTVAQVAADCGFVDAFHFSRRFRRVYGEPPRTFRSAARGEPTDPLAAAGLLPIAAQVISDDPVWPGGSAAPSSRPAAPD